MRDAAVAVRILPNDSAPVALGEPEPEARAHEAPSSEGGATTTTTVRIPRWIQIAWIAAGVLLLLDHAFSDEHDGWHSLLHPVTDTLTLAFVVFILLGVMINYVNEIGLPGGANLKLRAERAADNALDASEKYQVAAETLANQLQSWAEDGALLNDLLDRYGHDREAISTITTRFCLERMEDAAALLSLPGERARLSVWWYFESDGGLRLLLSNEIRDQRTWDFVFEPFEGLMGQAFVEGRQYNIADVRDSAHFIEIRADYEYRGLLLTPIVAGAQRRAVGIVSIDRTRARRFDTIGEYIGQALASFVAQVYTHPTVRRALPEMGL